MAVKRWFFQVVGKQTTETTVRSPVYRKMLTGQVTNENTLMKKRWNDVSKRQMSDVDDERHCFSELKTIG